jgi:hypothetical protein
MTTIGHMYAKQNLLYKKSPKFNSVSIYTYPKIQPNIFNIYRFITLQRNYSYQKYCWRERIITGKYKIDCYNKVFRVMSRIKC